MQQLKDINEITKQDKDDLFQSYIELIDPPTKQSLKEFKKEFYKNIIHREIIYMPYWLVMELYIKGYNVIDLDEYINDKK